MTKSTDQIVIKKYANRRLYNTLSSTYVTLEDLAVMVKDEEDFVVVDAKSGEDITRSVLTQIIFEQEGKGQNLLPVTFLRSLIQFYGDNMQAIVPSYLDHSMKSFMDNQDSFRETMENTFGPQAALDAMSEQTRRNMEIFQSAMQMFNPFAMSDATPKSTEAPKPKTEDTSELEVMKKQLAEMQDQLQRMKDK